MAKTTKISTPVPKNYAYLRVSTLDQDLEKNKVDILKLAHGLKLGHVEFVEEKVSGSVPWKKRRLGTIIEDLEKGDSIIVSELSRIGRNMLEVMEVLSIAAQKEVRVFAVKGNWQLDGSIQSKIIAMAFSIASEIERDLISQRTKEALRTKKTLGVKLGRPKGKGKSKLDPFEPEIRALLANGSTKTYVAKRYNTTLGNLAHYLSGFKS